MSLLQPHGARALWLLALMAMLAVGAAEMRRGLPGLPSRPFAADATSEPIFASLTNEREVPERLAAELAKLADDRPILILRPPANVLTTLPAYMVAYQAMPRPALIREVQLIDSAAAVEELRKNFSAVVFVGQAPPPAFPPGTQFGQCFVFVPLTASP